MFEYQGWATLQGKHAFGPESDYDESERILDNGLDIIRARMEKISYPHRHLQFLVMNGALRLSTMGFANRKGNDWQQVYDLFKLIAEVTPGSYGILSYRDSDDEKFNAFQVYALKRGELIPYKDYMLSPCNPEIEVFYDAENGEV